MNSAVSPQQPTTRPTSPWAESAGNVVDRLDAETKRALGLLHKTPRGIPELTIASFDYGMRSELDAYGLIGSTSPDERTLQVTITPLGREVIKLCAQDLPASESSDLDNSVEKAQSLLSLADASRLRTVPA